MFIYQKLSKNNNFYKVSLNCFIGWKQSAESYYMYQSKVVLDRAVEKMVSHLKAFYNWDEFIKYTCLH